MFNLPEGSYKEYKIPKKGGKFRKIVAPSNELLRYQRRILPTLESYYKSQVHRTTIQDVAHGFIKNKNCVTAAKKHIGFQATIMMDISEFFDSVKKEMLPLAFSNDENLFHLKGYAAQGFATSPMLANIAFIPAARQIHEALEDEYAEFMFTIYADDIQISVNSEDYEQLNETIEQVTAIIETSGFKVNAKKTRIKYAKFGFRRILGVNVGNTEVRATRRVMRKIRAAKFQGNGSSAGGLTTWSKCYLPKKLRR